MKSLEELLEEIYLVLEPLEASVPKSQEREVAKGLSEVEGLKDFLKATLAADMRRHFSASPEEQASIKGAFRRTLYLLSLCRTGGEQTKSMPVQFTGGRKSLDELQIT